MADGLHIFNDTPVTTESWALQGAVVLWGKGNKDTRIDGDGTSNSIPLIMNQVQVRYAVPVSTFTPLNSVNGEAKRILIKGVPEGTLTVQSIFTPNVANFKAFIEACQQPCRQSNDQVIVSIRPFGELKCQGKDSNGNEAQLQPGGIVFYLRGLDLRQFDFTISQQDQIAMTNMPLTFQFFDLEFDTASLKK